MNRESALTALTHATNWRKSTRSQGENGCVEVAAVPGLTGVRDSKLGASSPVLSMTDTSFRAFLADVKTGRFDQ